MPDATTYPESGWYAAQETRGSAMEEAEDNDDVSERPGGGKVAVADAVVAVFLVVVEGGTSCTVPFRATTSRVAYAPGPPPLLILPSPPPRPSSMSRRNVGESSG